MQAWPCPNESAPPTPPPTPHPTHTHTQDAAHPEGSDKQEGPHAGQLLLLKGITGSFRAGVLTALMGASGAGKTT
jgi:ABC-type transport system involved in cytochrome bd biosynthesis fused ATPase/permease subunit